MRLKHQDRQCSIAIGIDVRLLLMLEYHEFCTLFDAPCSLCFARPNAYVEYMYMLTQLFQPTTAFMLKLSRNWLRSSFFTSTTHCSKLSILTLALVSSTTS